MTFASRACVSTQRSFRPVPFSGLRPVPLRVSRNVGKASRSCVGPLSSCFQTTPLGRCLESPRLPRSCRANSLKDAWQDFLTSQLLVSDAPSSRTRERINKTATVSLLALIKAKHLLVQIAEQMERLDAHVGALDATLEQRPKVFDPVHMDAAFCVFLCVVDHVVCVLWIDTRVANPRIGEHLRTRFHVFADIPVKRGALDV